jgi:hypothetical protein
MIADKADKSVIDTLSTNITTTTNSLNDEIVRASKKEGELQSSIQDEVLRAKTVEQDLSTTLATKVSNVVLEKVDDLTYSLLVDGANMGQIKIPEDQFLKSVEIVNGSTLRFIFKTDSGTTTTDLDISSIVESAISDLSNRVTTLESDKAPINSPTFTGIAQVEISPDASQRIPSTNWVQERIWEAVSKVSTDIFYTKAEIA